MILIIGESCLDVFHYGECERLCPEAPVPVFNSTRTIENGGMAMNVYNNIKKLGGTVEIITNKNWKSIKKTRFVEEKSNHMFMRVDENDKGYPENLSLKTLNFELYDAIIVSDYNKGFLTTELLREISNSHPLTFLDTKKILGDWSEGFTYIKINGVEYEKTKHTINKNLYNKLIITQGQKGSIHKEKRYPVPMVEVKDVSGAGDTFISALCYYYLKTNSIEESINFANECATTVVQKRGVSTV
tara:strand:- start:1662 stop:2393 length:732 start_codon:yes stop_codon:yes gene_type:complete